MKSENMKRRVEEMPSFPHTAARPGGNTAIHRITTSPQNNITNSSSTQSQFHLMTVLKDQPGTTMVAPTTNIQYTYTPSSITNPAGLQKTTNIGQASNQVHVVNTTTLNMSNAGSAASAAAAAAARTKQASSIPAPTITTTQQPHVVTSPGSTASSAANASVSSQNFPRLKVEDALSYLDQVKYKFGNQPQVYNDFLDIMKEFKSQSIDTPGVIQRVSNLFKGHPELIVGFNTFLPPGYKIEVQANDQGFAYQVSVSVPSPSGNVTTIPSQHSPQPTKLQIIQGPGHIIQQSAVNLMTHSSHPTIHIQPSNTSSTTNSQSQDSSRPIQNTQLTSVNLTQNFSAVRDRNTNNLSGTNAVGNQTSGQQNQINTTSASIQHNLNPQQSQANDSNIRIAQYPNDNQPVQFNQAIVYVNKIKCRFQEQPEKYKHFLRILHKYQNEQRKKDNAGKGSSPLTESEVFKQVAHLFDNQEDLLREFGQFLPDATPNAALIAKTINSTSQNDSNDKHSTIGGSGGVKQLGNNIQRNNMISPIEFHQMSNEKDFHYQQFGHIGNQKDSNRNHMGNQKYGGLSGAGSLKRSPGMPINALNRSHERNEPPIKRHKPTCRDVSFADAAKYGTLQDYAFFDKVRETLKNPDVYDNFLRCLTIFNQEIVSKSELVNLVSPFLSKEPELLKKFQEFMKFSSQNEAVPLSVVQRQDLRAQTDTAAEIDVAQCKRLGTSYCALPKTSESKKCSGRTPLCREVLNDTWVSFPSWSEDSTFNASRKTQYEEFIYRCEDERFELDVVIETNSATIRVLEGVQKKMSKMTSDEINRFKLDDYLGGTSQTIHQRALRRIYADKAPDIIEGLKKNPSVAVPVVLRRLKTKEEEWREAQKGFNQQWREQNEKYYLKSLDHQGINFKHTDTKLLRSKSLMNQIETVYEERNEGNNGEAIPGPHLSLPYKDKTILEDAANLLIHHVKRQTGIQKQEKARIKHILRQFIPELFFAPRQPLSEDEKEDAFPFSAEEKDQNAGNEKTKTVTNSTTSNSNDVAAKSATTNENESSPTTTSVANNLLNPNEIKVEAKEDSNEKLTCYSPTAQGGTQLPLHAANAKHSDEAYTLFYGNSNWYYFIRLHSILCERLRAMYDRTQIMAAEEEKYKTTRRESAAIALRLKPQNEFEIQDYYPAFLDMLKSLLDGNMDSTTYEDKLRDMFGIHAYVAFTLDRVVSNAVRQLQFCVTERNAVECLELFQLESRNHATGGPCHNAHKRAAAENAYHRRAETSLQEDAYFKIFIYKVDCRVTIEMIENENEDNMASNFEQSQVSSKYVDRYANPNSSNSKNKSRNNSNNDAAHAGNDIEIKTEKTDEDMSSNVRKPLFLARNISKFNRGSARTPPAKLLIKSEGENSEMSNWKTANDINKEAPTSDATTTNDKTVTPATATETTVEKTTTTTTTITPESDASSVLTTSSSGVPPPLVLPKLPDPFWNKRPPERIGQTENYGDVFVDDQQQVKFNYNSYKSVFLSKGYILYRSNSLKRAKEAHPKVTKRMDEKFEKFVQKWLHKNVSDLQRVTINDWLLGRNQSNLLPNKTFIKRDNNLTSTPYRHFNRYKVEFIANENSSSSSSS